jgi:hypothetical protein
MDTTELFSMVYSVTWQQGIIYPEQNRALLDAIKLIDPTNVKGETTMSAGEIARHIGRVIKGEVWKPSRFRLTKEQREGLEQTEKMLLHLEDNLLDAEKGRYD